MSEILEFNKRARVRDEASLWLTRLQEGLSPEYELELRAWLAVDNAHESELLELATIWDELEVLTELAPLFEGVSSSASEPLIDEKDNVSSSPWVPLSIAASLLIAFSVGAYLYNDDRLIEKEVVTSSIGSANEVGSEDKPFLDLRSVQSFKTLIGEQLEIPMPDGTLATLNTDSQIVVRFSDRHRVIHLLQGEVHFDVFKDPTRPLKVLVSGKSVQAVGTAFSVRKKSGTDIEVAVDHGLVAVYQLDSTSKQLSEPALQASLDAGDVLTIADEQPQLTEYGLDQMEDRLAWRDGMIVINDETLDYVINEFSRYSEQKVLLADKKMGEIRVAGYFRLGDVDALLVALEKNFKIRSEYYQNNNTFVLSQI